MYMPVEVKDIDRYAHPTGVNARAGAQQQSRSWIEKLPPHQSN
jgi:hypothetical protein